MQGQDSLKRGRNTRKLCSKANSHVNNSGLNYSSDQKNSKNWIDSKAF